jgi:hypothetical protein
MNDSPPTEILLDEKTDAALALIDERASKFAHALSVNSAFGHLRRAAILALGIAELDKALAPLMPIFMSLQNSQLGFKTDRAPGNKNNLAPYDAPTVKSCLIAALLNGLYPIGNEFNIIAYQMYVAQAGYRRKVCQIPGLTDLVMSPGGPRPDNGLTMVRVAGTWKLNGIPGALVDGKGDPGRVFPIIVNQGMSPDAIVGKAMRKAYKAIYEQATGTESTLPDGEADEPGTELAAAETTARANKLEQAMNGNGHAPKAPPTPGANGTPKPEVVPAASRTTEDRTADLAQLEKLNAQIHRTKWDGLPSHLKNRYKARSAKELTGEQIEDLITHLVAMPTAEGRG